ncbi:MAG: YcxB family protein [Lachnospira sp.]
MVIKNKTQFTKECMEGAMRASNFDNNKYKLFKLIYNMFGLIFGMMLVRYLVFWLTGQEEADIFMMVFYGIVSGVFLYIGMVGLDRNNRKNYHNIYGKMIGVTFSYEIDSETITVTDEEDDADSFIWDDFIKWNQDQDNFYLFVSNDNCLVISKKGFTEGTEADFRELVKAIFGIRAQETEQKDTVDNEK